MSDNNFERLRKVLLKQGEPDRLPFYTHYLVQAVIDKVGEIFYLGDKNIIDIVGDKM